jgi:hypothetical protein
VLRIKKRKPRKGVKTRPDGYKARKPRK